MTQPNEQLEHLKEIRNIMERSSRFISLSGLSGVFAGFFALAGAAAYYIYFNKYVNYNFTEFSRRFPVDISTNFLLFCIADAAAVLVLALSFAFFFTNRKAKADGLKMWDATSRRLVFNLAVPLATGGVFCIALLNYRLIGLIAPATLIFYGLALVNASKYTLDEIRLLGYSEIVIGLISCFFIGYGVTFWAIGFGILHIIYGLIMYMKYEAKPVEKKYW